MANKRAGMVGSVAAAVAVLLTGCSTPTNGGQRHETSGGRSTAPPQHGGRDIAMLSAGSAPDFNTRGDYTQPGVLSTLDDCVALVTDEGDELLLFAPFGSEVTAQSPRIQIGDEEYDLGDEVELIGQAQDVFMPIGNAKPAAWEECVGGRADHTVMFVVGTS